MAKVRVDKLIQRHPSEFGRALQKTMRRHFPDANISKNRLLKDFLKEIQKAGMGEWTTVPDNIVDDG